MCEFHEKQLLASITPNTGIEAQSLNHLIARTNRRDMSYSRTFIRKVIVPDDSMALTQHYYYDRTRTNG